MLSLSPPSILQLGCCVAFVIGDAAMAMVFGPLNSMLVEGKAFVKGSRCVEMFKFRTKTRQC
jgi:hypothetical protein